MTNMEYYCPSCDRRIQNPRGVAELKCRSCDKTVALIEKPLSRESIKNERRKKSYEQELSPFAQRIFLRQSLIFPMMGFAGLLFAAYEWTSNPDTKINFMAVIAISIACICWGGLVFFFYKKLSA